MIHSNVNEAINMPPSIKLVFLYRIILYSDDVTIEFSGQQQPEFKGSKSGRIYLTTHRMIFTNKKKNDALKSFSFPFITLREVIQIPVFF